MAVIHRDSRGNAATATDTATSAAPPPPPPPHSLSLPNVKDAVLSPAQETLLHSLERRVQLQLQAERNPSLPAVGHHQHPQGPHEDSSSSSPPPPPMKAVASLREFLKRAHDDRCQHRPDASLTTEMADANVSAFKHAIDACSSDWGQLYTHAHQSFALVEEMESSHGQVVAKTQALYDAFEHVLQQVDALTTRVELIAAPLPHFVAIDEIARTLGFRAIFGAASPAQGVSTASADAVVVAAAGGGTRQPVQVFQHKRTIDPTTASFRDALEKIDNAVAFLEDHHEYKDAVCYIEAYRSLTAGAMQCLKDYAISGIDAARDAVLEAPASSSPSTSVAEMDDSSPYYVQFQLVAPSLTAVTEQLARLASVTPPSSATNANVMELAEVCHAYVTQRVTLLSPLLTTYFETVSQGTDIVNLLRVSSACLMRVCEAEFRLFLKLFGREPRDPLFVFTPESDDDHMDDPDDLETDFERLIFQLSGALYHVVRPQLLVQKDLETLCELVQVLQSEVIEAAIAPRAHVVGFVEPVMHRLIQDAQERLILCVQKYIRDEIEGYTPTATDLNYPKKLQHSDDNASMYATWYPTLEHTLLCLSKVYRFVNMEIFEELAQDAIQICTASLKMASADVSAAQGALHGTLFLVKHLLTLREQITPFEITAAVRAKSLDFTSSADAMAHLLSDVSAVFTLSMQENALVALFTRGIPQIQETTSDVKKELERELKKSCAAFIDAVLEQLAAPLLVLMKQIATATATSTTPSAGDLRQHAFFADPARIQKTLETVSSQISTSLPEILATIRLYLRNASTESILFKPVQRNLIDAIENVSTLLSQAFTASEREHCDTAIGNLLQQLNDA